MKEREEILKNAVENKWITKSQYDFFENRIPHDSCLLLVARLIKVWNALLVDLLWQVTTRCLQILEMF